MRRLLSVAAAAILIVVSSAARAQALTVHDVIELSKAGVSDDVLLALIDVDHRVYTLDATTVKQMKAAGVSDTVMLAMIHAGRDTAPAAPVSPADAQTAVQAPPAPAPQPQVVVIDHGAAQSDVREVAVPVPVPVAVPVAVSYPWFGGNERVSTIVTTDTGAALRARLPLPANCTKAEPIYWGNGGKRRPGTWEPPPQVVCR